MKSSLIALAVLVPAVSDASVKSSSGGYGAEYRTEDKYSPIERQVDDAALLRMRKTTDFESLVKKQRPQGWELNKYSEFLSFKDFGTLVPKYAVIHVPESLRNCVTTSLQGTFVPWKEFVAQYPAIVTTFDVTLEEAAGKKPIKPERLELIRKSDRIVVAVLNGSPISCRLAEPPATPGS